LEAMVALRDLVGERAEVELIAPRLEFAYRPLAVGEPFGAGRVINFDLDQLAERAGASFRLASVIAIDAQRRRVITHDGREVPYQYLLLAPGTRMLWTVPGAVTFWGVADEGGVSEVVGRLKEEILHRVIFTKPSGVGWSLPIYELALLAEAELIRAGVRAAAATLTVVTPEDRPLGLFGVRASEQVEALLAERGIELITATHPVKFDGTRLQVAPGGPIEADAVISTPRIEGRTIAGVPSDQSGFIAVDEHGRVRGMQDAFAAGDVTAFPVKQGGIAAQQAEVAAEAIAAELGSSVRPRPFEPVLRATLWTGEKPRYLYGKLMPGSGDTSLFSDHAPWEHEGKIVGHYLAPFLSSIPGAERPESQAGNPRPTPAVEHTSS
jgi:sulfide:quinone oxidoreductase